jgi:SAM-dependent methyltransferase
MTSILDPAVEADRALKAKHRTIWALGDYPAVAHEIIPSLGPILVDAVGIGPGDRVLDVAAGAGNAAIPAAERGATVVASDLTPELLVAGELRAAVAGVDLEWVVADAEALPFEDASFDVVMSAIGVMFAPHHQTAADELVRVSRPGGTVAVLSWTPEGMLGSLFKLMGRYAPTPPPGVQPPPLWGGEQHLAALLDGRVDITRQERDVLPVTAFAQPRDYGEHFKANYGPTIAIRGNAVKEGRADEFDAELDAFCDTWNRGNGNGARFEMEYLLTVGTRV